MTKRCTICNEKIEDYALLDSSAGEYICHNDGCIKVYIETLHWKDILNAIKHSGMLEEVSII